MKSQCESFENLMIDAIYNSLNAAEQANFDAHLAACKDCNSKILQMRKTLEIMDLRERELPDFSQMNAVIFSEIQKDVSKTNVISMQPKKIKWLIQFGTAAAILILGIFIGNVWKPQQQQPVFVANESADSLLIDETEAFIEASKLLLLGFVNTDINSLSNGDVNIDRYQYTSKKLVAESRILQTALEGNRKQRLKRLIDDLQIILLQIANLEADGDVNGIEILQDGLDNSDILFKINVEEIRRYQKEHDQKKKTDSVDETIGT